MGENKILNALNQDQFIESVKDNTMISIIGTDSKIAYVSIPFCSFLGFTEEELLKKDISIFNSHGQHKETFKILWNTITRGEKWKGNLCINSKEGKSNRLTTTIIPIKDSKQNISNFFVLFEQSRQYPDIEEYINYDLSYNILFNKTPIPKSLINLSNKKFIDVNKAWEDLTGYTKEEVVGKTSIDLDLSDSQEMKRLIEEMSLNEKVDSFKFSIKNKAGEKKKVIFYQEKFYVNEQEYLVTSIINIDNLEKSKLELQKAKEFSENLISSMQEGFIVVNSDFAIIEVNNSFCKMLGFKKNELLGLTPPYPYWPPELYEEINQKFIDILECPLKEFETSFMKKNGDKIPVIVSGSIIKNEEGHVSAYFGTVVDVSKRKKAELELKTAKEFTDKLVMSMQEGLIIVNLKGEILMVNDSTCKILGFSKDELVGLNLPYPFAKIEDFEKIEQTNKEIAKGDVPTFYFEFIRKNGEKFMASFLTGNIKNDQDEVIALFGTMKDISDEIKLTKSLEESARKSAERKEIILKLAGVISEKLEIVFREIISSSAKALNVGRVSVWSFNENKSEIHCQNVYNLQEDSFSNDLVLKAKDYPNYFKALAKNKTIRVNDARKDKITKEFTKDYLEPYGITSMMDVFIQGVDDIYGIVCFEHTGPKRTWTAEDEEFATSIANIVSLAVESKERKELEDKLVKTNLELSKAVEELNQFKKQLEHENIYLRNELDLVFNYEEMVYGSEKFSDILTNVEKVAPTDATVLLLGETGTGKELLARALHNTSLRNDKPLIKVNCAAIPRELIESELFGHKKGSFTGAISDKTGKVELANGGTLFLDEIGELPLDMQPKLLRFLQEGEIEKIGENVTRKLDVRVIAATNKDLKKESKEKRFREDLYFRLNVFPITVPALRERIEDIPLLVEHFVDKFSKIYKKNIKYISDADMIEMQAYKWPGNIRELENLIERGVILSNDEVLTLLDFGNSDIEKRRSISNTNMTLNEAQRVHIVNVLNQCNWKIDGPNGASVRLDIKPSTLRDRINKLGIKKPE